MNGAPTADGAQQLAFIMGAHRSGTTILYNLVARSMSCAFPTPFHIVTLEAFRKQGLAAANGARPALERRFAAASIADRFIDDLPAGLDTPEEYGFVLPGARLTLKNREFFDSLVEFVRSTCADGRAPLLLKNPRDFRRTAFVRKQFPDAKFIFIHRRPEHVLRSRGRELRDLFRRRSEYHSIIDPFYDRATRSPPAISFFRFSSRAEPWFSSYLALDQALDLRAYMAHARDLRPEQDLELRYEDLCARPAECLARIAQFLGRSARLDEALVASVRAGRADYVEEAPGALLLRRIVPDYYRRWGYAGAPG